MKKKQIMSDVSAIQIKNTEKAWNKERKKNMIHIVPYDCLSLYNIITYQALIFKGIVNASEE